MKVESKVLESELSLQRPGWTYNDLHAYKNKYVTENGKRVKKQDYFVKTKGMIR